MLKAPDGDTEAGAESEGGQEMPREEEAGQRLGGGCEAGVESPGALGEAEAGETERGDGQGGRGQQAGQAHQEADQHCDQHQWLLAQPGESQQLSEEAQDQGQAVCVSGQQRPGKGRNVRGV